jgi:hypothetical protein
MSIFDQLDAEQDAAQAARSGKAIVPGGAIAALDSEAAPPDKYRQAAEAEYAKLNNAGARMPTGYTARAIKGAGAGWADDIAAGSMVPFEMLKRGTLDPAEAYRYTRARETVNQEKLAENTKGALGTAAEVAGAIATGAGVLGSGTRAGAVAIPYTGKTLPAGAANFGLNAGKGAALGGFAGAGEAETVDDMAHKALVGGAMGGVLGGVIPMGVKSAMAVGAAAQLPRLRDADKIATEQLASVARAAGVTPEEMLRKVQAASAAGQPFTVADALGYEGQRKLTAMAKVPGPQRERIVETLTARDLNMPERAGAQVGASMGAPGTAQQASRQLIDTAGANAAPLYRQAETVPTWSPRLKEFIDDPIARQGLRQGVELQRLRSVGSDRPFNPQDAMITGFNEAGDPIISGVPNMQTLHTLKVGLDRMIENELNPATHRLTSRGEALVGFKNRMLSEIDTQNPMYAEARRAYGGPMEVNAAVRAGQQMPTRGRAADTVPAYEAMPPTTQAGVRIGWADTVRGQMERSGNFPTILRAKSPKGQAEIEAMAPYGPNSLREFLAREEHMQRTSKQALGGSATVENAADVAAGPGAALNMATSAASGNPLGFARSALDTLQRFGNPKMVQSMADRIAEHELRRRGVNPFVSRAPRYPEGQ